MYCPHCKNELPDWATVCDKCGNVLSQVDMFSMDDEQPQGSKLKTISIVVVVIIVLAIIISCFVVLASRKNNDSANKDSAVSINAPVVEDGNADSSFDENATTVVYFKEDADNYYRKYVINRDGEMIVSIEHSLGTDSSKFMNGEDFTQEQMDNWVKNYTEFFEQKKLDKKYIQTDIFSSSDEVRATVIIADMSSEEAQQYLESIGMISGYKAGMTYSQFKNMLVRDGYKRKQ